ncbi:MAG TPA: CBS domain-containing protein [Actinomycetota bacterium]|nr:CBS domain-containing protein [Actinomycetota bacterium]
MKARNLASPQATVRSDAPASEAAAVLARHDVRAVLIVDADDAFVGVLSDSELLRALLPPVVSENEALARVLEEGASEELFHRVEGRTVRDLMPAERDGPPVVHADDTLVEVALTMVRAHASLVGVLEDGRLVGGITIDDLISHLLKAR